MYRSNKIHYFFGLLCLAGLSLLASCEKPDQKEQSIVINELMTDNRTGILADDGETHAWIEICNISDSPVNLKDFALAKDSGTVKWDLPEKELQPDECDLVFVTKNNLKNQTYFYIPLSSKGGNIQLITKEGEVISDVEYGKLSTDQSLARTEEGTYKETFSQTPGYTNDDEGRAQYLKQQEERTKGPLCIWEYLGKSGEMIVDGSNQGNRWVEVKNISQQPVNLSGYYLTSDITEKDSLAFPKKQLAAGEVLLVRDVKKKLSGQSIVLAKEGKFVDGICAVETYMGVSIGRQKDKSGWYYFDNPTPGAENSSKAYPSITPTPELLTKGGIYMKDKVYVSLDTHGSTVHYTIDGTIPTKESPVYKDGILITSTTILRAFAEDSVNLRSKMITASYLVNEKHTLPVVSVTMDDEDLYSETKGIYVKGPHAEAKSPYKGANFWKPWEKCAHVEFFDGDKGFTYDCGVKIFGAYSRGRDKKSLHIKFRDRYEVSNIKYDLYKRGKEEKVKSFVLRSGSQDDNGTMVRDEFFTTLMAENSPTLHIQYHRPVVLYLNGKYWGVYYIREKINEEYVANHLGVSKDSVTLLVAQGAVQVGSAAEYRALEDYARSHNMRDPEVYKYMDSQIDFQNLIDYKIGEFYTGNCDVGNIRFFKSSDPDCNQKWHWLYYDLDWGFYYYTSLRFYIREGVKRGNGGSVAPYNLFVNRLLQNPEFRKLFLERWSYHRKNTISKEHALEVFNRMINTIQPEMERNCERWPKMSYQRWQTNVEKFRVMIAERPAKLDEMVKSELSVTDAELKKYFNQLSI